MEKELKEYLRLTGVPEKEIAEMERNSTEAELNAMRSFAEILSGKPLTQLAQEEAQRQQEREAAREKAIREARQKAREERANKRNGFALGLGFPFFLVLLVMLFKWFLG